MPELKFYYFDLAGKGEGIRLACTVGKLPFEDIRLTREQFMEMKTSGELPYGQVPALSVDGKLLCQSGAILRYIGKKTGQYPTDDVQAAIVDGLLAQEGDMFTATSCARYQDRFGFSALGGADSELTKTVEKAIAEEVMPKHLGFLEKVLGDSATGCLAGTEGPSPADFQFVPRLQWINSGTVSGIPAGILDSYPKVTALVNKLMELPEVKAYYASKK